MPVIELATHDVSKGLGVHLMALTDTKRPHRVVFLGWDRAASATAGPLSRFPHE